MKTRFLFIPVLCAASALLLIVSPAAQAGYIVTLQQVGADVVATGSGAINLTGLFLIDTGPQPPALIWPSLGVILTGPTNSGTVDVYRGATGPISFGRGRTATANIGSGDFVGIERTLGGLLFVPEGYVSGTALSGSSTYNTTFASLGVRPRTCVWTWGTGVNQNFTLQIGAVPDAGSTLGLLLVAASGLFALSRFRSFLLT